MLPELLLDIDGVAANFIEGCRPVVEQLAGRTFDHDDIDQWLIEKALKLDEAQTVAMYKRVVEEGWCRSLPAYEGARESVDELRTFMTVIPVTAHFFDSKHWVYERDEWILEKLGIPKVDVVHTHRKFQIDGDVLVDDKPSHIRSWIARRPSRHGVLFQRKYNANEPPAQNVAVINGWPALVAHLRQLFA